MIYRKQAFDNTLLWRAVFVMIDQLGVDVYANRRMAWAWVNGVAIGYRVEGEGLTFMWGNKAGLGRMPVPVIEYVDQVEASLRGWQEIYASGKHPAEVALGSPADMVALLPSDVSAVHIPSQSIGGAAIQYIDGIATFGTFSACAAVLRYLDPAFIFRDGWENVYSTESLIGWCSDAAGNELCPAWLKERAEELMVEVSKTACQWFRITGWNAPMAYAGPVIIERTDEGLLLIVADLDQLREFVEEYPDDRAFLHAIMEEAKLLGNGWHCVMNAGLTEAPVVGYGAMYPVADDGKPCDYDEMWFYNDYNINHFGQVLIDQGSVTFTRHDS